jgi:23S rRNA pseudouridine955/2504/2580 synthase
MKKRKYFRELKTGPDDAGRRLDRVLRKALPDYSLSLIHRLLRQGNVRLDGKPASPADRVQAGAVIRLVLHEELLTEEHRTGNSVPPCLREGNLGILPEILWRGAGIIVFNKPPGLAAHGESSLDTLVNAWLEGKLPPSLSFKPGPLHRLDKPTSGAVAFSETIEGARLFSRLLRERKAAKTYLAIVEGRITGAAVWQDELVRDSNAGKTFAADKPGAKFIAGKNALTAVKALASNGSHTLIEARIVTGRTHQIRAQAAAHGHPLAGDRKYGGSGSGGFFLHAWKLDLGGRIAGFPQPLIAPLPAPFQSRITALFEKKS